MAASVALRRVALVTGAATLEGMGRCIALRLAQDGLSVAVNDLPSKRQQLDDVVSEINSTMASASGQRAVAVTGDVSKEEDVKAMVESVAHQLGGLDVVRPVRFRFHADSSPRGSSYADGRQRRDPPLWTADRS